MLPNAGIYVSFRTITATFATSFALLFFHQTVRYVHGQKPFKLLICELINYKL